MYRVWAPHVIAAVWEKGREIPGYDRNLVRTDICGSVMSRHEHGELTKYGWEIDHIKPEVLGGTDDIWNLQPLQWENNRRKGDTYPWHC